MSLLNAVNNEDKILRMPDLDYTPDPRGLGYVFFQRMVKNQNKIAQIDGLTGVKDTYGSLLQRCIRTAISMRSKGVTSDDIVCVCTLNHLNSCVPYIATLFLGAKITALDPTLFYGDMVHLLKQVTPKMLFVTPPALEQVAKALEEVGLNTEIVLFGETTKYASFSDFLLPKSEEDDFKPHEVENPFDTAMIFFSSGTSGLSKAICINHFHFISQLENFIRFGFCLGITLAFNPLHWITSVCVLGTTLLTGSTSVILPTFNAKTVWKAADKYKPTFVISVPYQLLAMVREEGTENLDISSVKHIAIGGACLVENQILEIRKGFPKATVYTGYGQTETSMPLTIFKPCSARDTQLMIKKPSSSGTGVPGFSYKVVDPDTEEVLGPNQSGELRIKSKFVLNGYYKLDSSEVWDADGWCKTGDIVYYDEDLCFYVVDRIKELLKFRAFHVQPAALESLLLTHPAVAACVVIGKPHEEDGDHPMAIVVLKESHKDTTSKEIETYVEERVDDRKKLRGGVKFADHLLLSSTEKVKRREMRNMVLRGEL